MGKYTVYVYSSLGQANPLQKNLERRVFFGGSPAALLGRHEKTRKSGSGMKLSLSNALARHDELVPTICRRSAVAV